jgi:hypothetical protein
VRGEVQHGADAVLAQQARDESAVARVADHERRFKHGAAKSAREVVEDHDVLAARAQLAGHVAADVAGAAGHENGVHRAKGWRPVHDPSNFG